MTPTGKLVQIQFITTEKDPSNQSKTIQTKDHTMANSTKMGIMLP